MYCAGWAQEIANYLLPLDSLLGSTTRADLSPWTLNSFRWLGKIYGVPIVSNPMILFANQRVLDRAGISSMPGTWDELVSAAAAVDESGATGWTMAGGQTGGLGGLFTNWQLFFLQAGGDLFDQDNRPLFASDSGVAAIEMLQRLLPYSDNLALSHTSLLDASVAMMRGEVGFMANWAVMYRSLADPAISSFSNSVSVAPLPTGPAGNGSVDSGDGWTIDSRTWVANKTMSLLRYFLEPAEQIRMYEETGWLPASLTALADEDLHRTAPHAKAVQEQIRHRIDSGFRPDFDAVSSVIGMAVWSALVGEDTPIGALRLARDQLIRSGR
jgi:ABC-type glycerol-3-phosphate transport system substrate-binding protein